MKTHITPVLRLAGAIVLALATALPSMAQAPAAPSKPSDAKLERIHRNNRRKAEEMMARDSRVVSGREMGELEKTYQIANKNTRSPEAIAALKTVIEKWPKTNRAGCAALYLGRWTAGDEQEKYLRLSITEYSKCYYLDGTSVGAYARLILGVRLKQAGKEAEAKTLFEEIRKDYADAEEHTDKLIVDLIPQ
jgi:hypothetical protein